MRSLKGKVAIITGAAGDLGRALTRRFLSEGVKVVGVDINPKVIETLEKVREDYAGSDGFTVVADITKVKDVQNMVSQTVERYGRVDILVNNAAINKPANAIITTSQEDFNELVDVNFKAIFLCTREVAKEMIKKKSGNIVNIGSYFGKTGHPFFSVYCATKGATVLFTQVAAIELAPHNIRVNEICPGDMDTEMHNKAIREEAEKRGMSFEEMYKLDLKTIPMRRVARTEEIAAGVAFLVSDEAQYITGQAININGGREFH